MAADRPTCYRCDDPVDDAHRIQLSAAHAGEHADRVRDVTRRICLDCLAAIGMLEFSVDERQNLRKQNHDKTDPSRWSEHAAN